MRQINSMCTVYDARSTFLRSIIMNALRKFEINWWQALLSVYKFEKVTQPSYLVSLDVFFFVSSSLHLVHFGHLLRCADERIVNIMKVYIERNDMQVELLWYSKKCWLYYWQICPPNALQEVSNINHFSSVSNSLDRLVAPSECMASLWKVN